jgi:hypothetical protein
MVSTSIEEAPRPLKLRENEDRRTQVDRRRSSVDMRLRVGLWYQYHRATRSGEFDPLPRNPYTRTKLQDALLPEVGKYEFANRDGSSAVPAKCALSIALEFIWAHPELGCNVAGEPTAVYTINSVSEYLVRSFEVRVIDRRKSERRTVSASAS